jgi:hypothetical protein
MTNLDKLLSLLTDKVALDREVRVLGVVNPEELGIVGSLLTGKLAVCQAQYRGQRVIVLGLVTRTETQGGVEALGVAPLAMMLRAEDMAYLTAPGEEETKELPTGVYL